MPEVMRSTDYHYPGDVGIPDGPSGWWTRWPLRAPWWPFVLLALLFGFYYFWRYRSPSVAMARWTNFEDTVTADTIIDRDWEGKWFKDDWFVLFARERD